MDIILLIILQPVAVCVYAWNREWNVPLYPRSLELPLHRAVINRPRNSVNSTVYIPWNGCTPKSKEIEGDFKNIYIHVSTFFFPFEFLLSRGKKLERFLLYAIYNFPEKSYYFRTVINFYGLTMLNSMFENWGESKQKGDMGRAVELGSFHSLILNTLNFEKRASIGRAFVRSFGSIECFARFSLTLERNLRGIRSVQRCYHRHR